MWLSGQHGCAKVISLVKTESFFALFKFAHPKSTCCVYSKVKQVS